MKHPRAKELKNFSLGSNSEEDANQHPYPTEYSPKLLEAFANRNPQQVAWTSLICTEFTSLCPKTGQPDFAKFL